MPALFVTLLGYNAWREWCGLSRAYSFDDFIELPVEVRRKFSEIYR